MKKNMSQRRPNYIAAKVMGWAPSEMTKWLYNHKIPLKGLTPQKIIRHLREDGRYVVPSNAIYQVRRHIKTVAMLERKRAAQ